ncbi:hypothetical protein EV426DRAFT_677571 [Tirmania nivea]|nr:hypothetical protein EV426DRAFT_677571 [Tirmania nivea]
MSTLPCLRETKQVPLTEREESFHASDVDSGMPPMSSLPCLRETKQAPLTENYPRDPGRGRRVSMPPMSTLPCLRCRHCRDYDVDTGLIPMSTLPCLRETKQVPLTENYPRDPGRGRRVYMPPMSTLPCLRCRYRPQSDVHTAVPTMSPPPSLRCRHCPASDVDTALPPMSALPCLVSGSARACQDLGYCAGGFGSIVPSLSRGQALWAGDGQQQGRWKGYTLPAHRLSLRVRSHCDEAEDVKPGIPAKRALTPTVRASYPALEVPDGTRWHNVVHVTLLKPFRQRDVPQDMDEDEKDIFEVESIVDSRKYRGVVKYRVRWVGYTEYEDTWETFDRLDNCPEKLTEYREKFPNKPRDTRDV